MKKNLFFAFCCLHSLHYAQISQQQAIVIPPPQSDPKIVLFNYDSAGNQIYRGPNELVCSTCKGDEITNLSLADQIGDKIQAAPVPVKTDLQIVWNATFNQFITQIELLPYNANIVLHRANISSYSGNSYILPMSTYAYGVYYLKFYFTDGSVYTRTITKN